MKAELKELHSPDVYDLQAFEPADPTRFTASTPGAARCDGAFEAVLQPEVAGVRCCEGA
jgi:hypothetical protein